MTRERGERKKERRRLCNDLTTRPGVPLWFASTSWRPWKLTFSDAFCASLIRVVRVRVFCVRYSSFPPSLTKPPGACGKPGMSGREGASGMGRKLSTGRRYFTCNYCVRLGRQQIGRLGPSGIFCFFVLYFSGNPLGAVSAGRIASAVSSAYADANPGCYEFQSCVALGS